MLNIFYKYFFIREERLRDLFEVFGIEENADSNSKINYYIDFVD